jgi:D-sedoheptulose 7-phosphate isomerase
MTPSPQYAQALRDHLDTMLGVEALAVPVQRAAELMARTLREGGKLMFCGNGGSAADCQHLAAEFIGRFVNDRAPLAALALTTDTSTLTCVSNDYAFDRVFERQVIGLAHPGDCLIGISTSGNSANVLRAVEAARSRGVHCIGLLGRDGGALAPLCDPAIVVSASATARIQEAHIFIGHMLCALVEEVLGVP